MATRLFFLKPESPFHLQTGGGDHESVDLYPRSDTLSSSLLYWWFRQFKNVEGFPEKLPYRVSSIFPAICRGNEIKRLYPKPSDLTINTKKHNHKLIKRVQWFDEELFERWRAGNDIQDILPAYSNSPHLKRSGKVLVLNPEKDFGSGALLKTDARTRVVLDRVFQASTPFHFVQVCHAEDISLWFLAEIEPAFETQFLSILRLLGDEGIGADRTVGMGMYALESWQDFSLNINGEKKFFNLGVYNPNPDEVKRIKWEDSSYHLETRGGWVTGTSLRRKPLSCITESSIMLSETPLEGNNPCVVNKDDPDIPENVRPEYSVYRDCRSFFIPCT